MSENEIFLKPCVQNPETKALPFTLLRGGETRLGQCIHTPDYGEILQYDILVANLRRLKQEKKLVFALIGISEDIGPRANCGKPGAVNGWRACMQVLVNMQSNSFVKGNNIIALGEIYLEDLQNLSRQPEVQQDLPKLRQLVEEIDRRVEAVVSAVLDAGLEPIVIGGGHNNAYPVLKSLAKFSPRPPLAINLDPHSDCRLLEGRHSGNPFSYAFTEGILGKYILFGMDPHYNSRESIEFLEKI